MSSRVKVIVSLAVAVLLALSVVRAATHRYQEREEAFRKECQAAMKSAGLTTEAAKQKYPTPEINLVSSAHALPGGTADLVVSGKFSAGSKFFVENDNIQIQKEALTGNQYRATVQAAPGIGPETAAVAVISPRGQLARQEGAVLVGGRHEWTLQAANGWKVVVRSVRTDLLRRTASSDDDPYEASFFRPGEATAFQKLNARVNFSLWDNRNFRFTLAAPSPSAGGMADYQALMQKMGDPKLTDAQRDALMKQLEQATKQMQAAMTPENINKQVAEQQRWKQEFGCDSIALTVEAGKASGEMRCSQKVGSQLALTGTMALMK